MFKETQSQDKKTETRTKRPSHIVVIQNTKVMEDDFINKNLDLNREPLSNCKDKDGNSINFISTNTQRNVLNRILAEATLSVTENTMYDETDTQEAKSRRIYSRKKEIIRDITTLFDNGGNMVKYYKYVTFSHDIFSPKVTRSYVRKFIKQIRNAVNDAEEVVVDGVVMLKLPEQFVATMRKLKLYTDEEVLRPKFIQKEFTKKK